MKLSKLQSLATKEDRAEMKSRPYRSLIGCLMYIATGHSIRAPVVFKSKYQRTVGLSSAEAENMALSLCMQEVLWVRAMLKGMGREQVGGTRVWEDNQGAIALARNAGYHFSDKARGH
ncbi:unnamed protein product [Peronospora belbahrii]|uniref:Reverse transcriptase Ty1/copia-type domain-containing protein n=1 Tax=Peronospora belbahrii TaxID=622444 RepID=A0AAU9LMJ0_9STRA|nr:unnamed protein product [Peronospora belbahrii]